MIAPPAFQRTDGSCSLESIHNCRAWQTIALPLLTHQVQTASATTKRDKTPLAASGIHDCVLLRKQTPQVETSSPSLALSGISR
jgi:hypothetical protein